MFLVGFVLIPLLFFTLYVFCGFVCFICLVCFLRSCFCSVGSLLLLASYVAIEPKHDIEPEIADTGTIYWDNT